jgi:hypothetical protein
LTFGSGLAFVAVLDAVRDDWRAPVATLDERTRGLAGVVVLGSGLVILVAAAVVVRETVRGRG